MANIIPFDPRFKASNTMCFYSYHFKTYKEFHNRIQDLLYDYMNFYWSPLRLDFDLNMSDNRSAINSLSSFSKPSGLFTCRLYMSCFICCDGEYPSVIVNVSPRLRLWLASNS